LAELRSELDEVSQRITALRERNPRLQHYVTELEAQLGEAGDRIRDNQNQINAVIRQSEALRSQQEAAVRKSRIQGRISAFLEDSAERAPDELRIRLALSSGKWSYSLESLAEKPMKIGFDARILSSPTT